MLVLERGQIPQAGEVLRDFNDGKSYIVIETKASNWEDRYEHINLMCLTDGEPYVRNLRDLFFFEYLE